MMVSKGWAVYSPVTKRVELASFYTSPVMCRRWAAEAAYIYRGETWADLKKKGYRVVRVTVTMRETKS